MKVPLIIYNPAAGEGSAVREENVTLLDVAPTIAGMMGLKIPRGLSGPGFGPIPRGAALEIFEETFKPEAARDKFGHPGLPLARDFHSGKAQTRSVSPGERPGRDPTGLLPAKRICPRRPPR